MALQLLATHLCLRVHGSLPRVMYVVSAALAKPPSKPHLQQHDKLSAEPCTQYLKAAANECMITLQAWFKLLQSRCLCEACCASAYIDPASRRLGNEEGGATMSLKPHS